MDAFPRKSVATKKVKYLRQSRRLENREPLKAGLFIYHLKVAELK
jgi:hypothetical protein